MKDLSMPSMACQPEFPGRFASSRLPALAWPVDFFRSDAHRAPIPEEEPIPGEEPEPDDDPVPHPDPIVREPGEPMPLQLVALRLRDKVVLH